MNGGKGFGGGEATRDPAPTEIDPNDPKGKQQAIHKAESFADYLARRKAEDAKGGDPSTRSGEPVMNGGKGFGGGEATRDPAPTEIDPNDPKGKQQAIHKAESFADYLARRKAEDAKAGDPEGGSRSGSVNMVMEPGLTVPADLKLQEGPFPPMEINLAKRFEDKNVVLVGLPGAFTPT